MANKLLIKRSSVANKVPTTTDLALGELGLNTNDGKLYLKKDDGTAAIVEVAVKNSSGNLGIGTAPSARLHVLSTTEQLRAAYDASNYVTLTVGSTGGVTLDAVGSGANFTFNDNVGIAATPSAWSSDFKTLTLGTTFGGTVWTYVPEGGTGVASNVYHDGASWKYRSNGYVALTESRAVDGAHIWYTAASGTAGSVATLYRTMQIDNSGNLGIGIASASARLHLVSTTEQLRIGYDAGNYYSVSVSSGGTVWHTMTGGAAYFKVGDGTQGIAMSAVAGGTISLGRNDSVETTPLIDFTPSGKTVTDARLVAYQGAAAGATAYSGQLRLYSSEFWHVSAAYDAAMLLSRPAGKEYRLYFCTYETSLRFAWVLNNTAESGSNAGSDFVLRRYSDASASLGDVLFVRRSDGQIGIGTSSPTVPLDVNGVIKGTQLRGGYNDTTGTVNTAAQALGTNTVSRVLISASTTLTTTVPPAGAHASVIIQTSGTVSRTVTFGTGFKSQGTLATGAVADRYWVVNFVSDGTSLYETSRTTTAYA